MLYDAGFTVNHLAGSDHLAPICCDDSLVTQTDAQGGDRGAHLSQDPRADPEVLGVLRVAGSGGDDYLRRGHLHRLLEGYPVVPVDHRVSSQLPDVLDEVVDEGVIVVDDEDLQLSPPPAASRAFKSAAALCSVSYHSFSGSESATIPPPAWMVALSPSATRVLIVMAKSAFPL